MGKKIRKVKRKMKKKVRKAAKKAKRKEKKAMRKAKRRGARAVRKAKKSPKKKAVVKSAAIATVVTLCKKLTPPTKGTKDGASMCGTVKKEGHCKYTNYARYCAKTCGICKT